MQFCQYSFILKLDKLKLNTKKFPGFLYVSWNLTAHHKEGDTIFGPAISDQSNMLTFTQQVTIKTKLAFNTQQQHFHPKKSILHFLHFDKQDKTSKYTNVGVITIDLATLVNNDQQTRQKIYQLQKCIDRTASILLSIKSNSYNQIHKERKSLINITDLKVDQKQQEKSKQSFYDQFSRSTPKIQKKPLLQQNIKTNEKRLRALSTNTNIDAQSIPQTNSFQYSISQFRSQQEFSLSRQINDEREQNNILSARVIQLQQIIRKSNSNETLQTITDLKQSLDSSKSVIDSLKHHLKQSTREINNLNNNLEVLQLENKQLKSQILTASKLSKKIKFNLQQQAFVEDIKQQLKKQKQLAIELENKLSLQSQEVENIKTQNQNLMQQIDDLLIQLQDQRKLTDKHRVQYEELKLKNKKRRKQKQIKYKQKIAELSKQVLRLHDELYNLRIIQKQINDNQQLINENQSLKAFCRQKKKFQSIKDTVGRMSRNKSLDDQVLKTIRSKSKQMKQKHLNIESIDTQIRKIILSVTQIRNLNVKPILQNNSKLSLYLNQMQNNLQKLLQQTIQK